MERPVIPPSPSFKGTQDADHQTRFPNTAAAGALGFGLAPRAFAQATPQSTPQRPPRQAGPLPDGIERAAKPLRILILGGTGFTGPHQVRDALARGHRVTLFNRGRNPVCGRVRSRS